MRRVLLAFVIGLAVSCGGSNTPAGPSTSLVSMSGLIFDAYVTPQAPVAGARVDITSGPGAGRTATTDAAGRYRFDGLERGTVSLHLSADNYQAVSREAVVSTVETTFLLVPLTVRVTGRAVDILTQAGFAGVAIDGGGRHSETDGSGAFAFSAPPDPVTPVPFVFAGPQVVERRVGLRLPGRDAVVSLIPSGFDLGSFDEMFRQPTLLRWQASPPLTIETRTAQYVERNATVVTTLADEMSPAEYDSLKADLEWTLPQLTGGTFPAFAGVTRQSSAEGASVTLLNRGSITVIRVKGLRAAGFLGLGRWQFLSDGTVVGGMIMLDIDWERSRHPGIRSTRSHELGHALGYNHVTRRLSVMNPVGDEEVNDFDRQAAIIAFQRPPGNRAPDIDPESSAPNRVSGPAVWSSAIR